MNPIELQVRARGSHPTENAAFSYFVVAVLFVVVVVDAVVAGFLAGGVVVFAAGAGCFSDVWTTAGEGFWAVVLAAPACAGAVTAVLFTAAVLAGTVVGRAATAGLVFGAAETAGAAAVLAGTAALPTGTADVPLTFVAGVHGVAALAVVAGVAAAFFLWNNEPRFEIAWLALLIAPLAFWF